MISRLVIAAGALALLASTAGAQPANQARKHFEQAEAYLKAELYDRAADEYQKAYDLSKKPVLLFNVGLAREKNGEAEAAIAAYDAYLAVEPDGVKSAEARARAEALRRALASDKPAPDEPITDPDRPITDPDPPITDSDRPITDRDPDPPITDREPDPPIARDRPSLVPAIAVGAGGLVLAGIGIGFGASASSTLEDLDRDLETGSPPIDTGDPRFDDGRRKALYANLAFAASGVSLVVAGVLAYRALAGGDATGGRSVAVTPTAGGAVVEVRW